MKIYTRRGDRGETTLHGGASVEKSDPRVESYGTVDELNAVLGGVLSLRPEGLDADRLVAVQEDLFVIGARLAASDPARARKKGSIPVLAEARVEELETWIDEVEVNLPELDAFILPGGCPAGARLHVARTVCRRAERAISTLLADQPDLGDLVLPYMNRLSDLLFVVARGVNEAAGSAEQRWIPVRRRPRGVTHTSSGEQ
jgi:cob(I)alamin adenosyltransferase